MTTVRRSAALAEADYMWRVVCEQFDALTEEELLWEPVAGCWSVRPKPDGRFHVDWSPSPPVEPFTTIAWRLAHIGTTLSEYARALFGQGSFSFEVEDGNLVGTGTDVRAAGTVDGMRRYLESAFGHWRRGIEEAGDFSEELADQVRVRNLHSLVHAVEIGPLRHLYRAWGPLDAEPLVDACMRGDRDGLVDLAERDLDRVRWLTGERCDLTLTAAMMGRWNVIETLLDFGFPVDTAVGATALHYAAAFGPLDVVRLLVERGADLGRRDPQFDATPYGWAEYFRYQAAMSLLAERAEAG